MMSFLQLIKDVRESVGDAAFSMITGIPALLYARWRFYKDRQFCYVSNKIRIQTLRQIDKLWSEGVLTDFKRSEIKVLYERIGLTFPIEISRQFINFLERQGISYCSIRVRHFLRCRDVVRTLDGGIYFSRKNARRSQWVLGLLPIPVTIIILAGILTSMRLSSGYGITHNLIDNCFMIIYACLWLVIAVMGWREWHKMANGIAFWNMFSPFLKVNGINTGEKPYSSEA